jgi:hypothetical protein
VLRFFIAAAALFTLSMVIWRKMTAIIWKVEPLPRPAVKTAP